jgi:hypothetical protein
VLFLSSFAGHEGQDGHQGQEMKFFLALRREELLCTVHLTDIDARLAQQSWRHSQVSPFLVFTDRPKARRALSGDEPYTPTVSINESYRSMAFQSKRRMP